MSSFRSALQLLVGPQRALGRWWSPLPPSALPPVGRAPGAESGVARGSANVASAKRLLPSLLLSWVSWTVLSLSSAPRQYRRSNASGASLCAQRRSTSRLKSCTVLVHGTRKASVLKALRNEHVTVHEMLTPSAARFGGTLTCCGAVAGAHFATFAGARAAAADAASPSASAVACSASSSTASARARSLTRRCHSRFLLTLLSAISRKEDARNSRLCASAAKRCRTQRKPQMMHTTSTATDVHERSSTLSIAACSAGGQLDLSCSLQLRSSRFFFSRIASHRDIHRAHA